jgi:hypothetical protein
MNAAPSLFQNDYIDENSIKLDNINCLIHQNNKLVGICVDKNCNNQNKYMCLDCMFENHSGHVGIKLNQIENSFKQKINSNLEESNHILKIHKKFYESFKDKIKNLKAKINNILDRFQNNIMENIEKMNKLGNFNEINIIKNNYPPQNNEQLNNLMKELLKIHNNKNNNEINKDIIKAKYDNFEKKLQKKIESIENYFNDLLNFKLGDEEFEWSTKTYGDYKYYYKLEDENRKIIKIDANGTITICKTIQSLKPGRKYKIDYFVDYLYGDDFDVGFGDDQIGPLCWLRGSGGYGITSKGIYLNSGNCSNSAIKITSNIKKISFIVDLLNYTSEIYLDNTKVYSNFSINRNLTYYPMAAIRQFNNSVKLYVSELN